MTEPTRKPRKRNPTWKDTPEQKAARMRNRRKLLKDFAIAQGYTSWEALATAILNGEIKIVKADESDNEKL